MAFWQSQIVVMPWLNHNDCQSLSSIVASGHHLIPDLLDTHVAARMEHTLNAGILRGLLAAEALI